LGTWGTLSLPNFSFLLHNHIIPPQEFAKEKPLSDKGLEQITKIYQILKELKN